MLEELFPRFHRKYLSLPIFGVALDRFAHWLFDRGYPRHLVRRHLSADDTQARRDFEISRVPITRRDRERTLASVLSGKLAG